MIKKLIPLPIGPSLFQYHFEAELIPHPAILKVLIVYPFGLFFVYIFVLGFLFTIHLSVL